MFDFRRGVAGGVWGRSDGAVPVGNELARVRQGFMSTGDYTETQMPWT